MSLIKYCGIENNLARCKKLIASKKCDINEIDKIGNTPLMEACQSSNYLICELLLINKADINIENDNGITAFIYSIYHNNHEADFIYLFVKYKANIDDNMFRTHNYNEMDNIAIRNLLMKSGYLIYGDNCKNNDIKVDIEFKKRKINYKGLMPLLNIILRYT